MLAGEWRERERSNTTQYNTSATCSMYLFSHSFLSAMVYSSSVPNSTCSSFSVATSPLSEEVAKSCTYKHMHACTNILAHTQKSKKAKFLAATEGHVHLASQDVCALSRYYVPVRCNLLEPGQGDRRSTDCTSHCRCGHRVVPPVPLAVREAQPVHFAPQYKTCRYPFYRWVGWRYFFDGQKFPSCPGIKLVSSGL